MEKLHARVRMDDRMLGSGIPKKIFDKRIAENLSYELAKVIVNHDIDKVIVKRDLNKNWIDPIPFGHTEYSLNVHLLTEEEYKEFMELREYRNMLQGLVAFKERI